MTNEELTYAKEAKRKHGANVVEQEFAQPKHHKDPPEEQQKNKSACATSQQGTSCRKPSSIITAALRENLPPEKRDQSANRNKGEETPPTSTSVENKTP